MQVQKPTRGAFVALLAAGATLALAAPASADTVIQFDGVTGKLTVTFDGVSSVELGSEAGKVTLNDDPQQVNAADVKTIEVREDAAGTQANTVDLSAVDSAAYTQLTSTLIQAAGGDDKLTGSQLDDRIVGARNADTMSGKDGDDTLVWNNGDGNDVMNGGDGIDTIESNGADVGSAAVDETYTVETVGKRFLFKRISTGAFQLDVGGAERYVNNLKGGNDKFSTLDPAQAVAGIDVTLNGEAGNDDLTGTNDNDVINGGADNDRIVGFRGNDTMNGDDGDDTLIWNNGDGTDRMDGGAGNDVAQQNGANAGNDHFIVSANGQRVTATRDNLGPFFLDISTTETLQVNGQGGDDSVDVNNGLAPLIAVQVNLGDGNDSVRARNDSAQAIDGGTGSDSAVVDATDIVSNVEAIDAPVVTPPPPPAVDAKAPKAAIKSRRLNVDGGRAAVRFTVPADEDQVDARIRILRGGKIVGSLKATDLEGGETRTFKVQLKRNTRIALAKAQGKKLRVTVKVQLTDAAGNKATASRQLNLKG